MAYNHQEKKSGDIIRSADWNALGKETEELGRAKVNRSGGDTLQGPLKVVGGAGANRMEVHGNLHLNGGSLFLREGVGDQSDVVKWNTSADRVDVGGFNGVALGHTRGTPGAVNAVLTVRQDSQVEISGSLSVTAVANNVTRGVSVGAGSLSATSSAADQSLTIASKGAGAVLINPSGGNVAIGAASPNAANKLEVHGPLHMNGSPIFLRQNTADQYDVVEWNNSTDRVDVGGFSGVALGHTRNTPGAVNPVLTVRHDGQVDVNATLALGGALRFSNGSEQRSAVRMASGRIWFDGMKGAVNKSQYITLSGFTATPTILVALAKLDVQRDWNTRVEVKHSGESANGFTITLSCWGDTQLYYTDINWIAIGY